MLRHLVLAGIAGTVAFAAPAKAQEPDTILNVSYDVGRELYTAASEAFAKSWKAQTGKDIKVNQSNAGTSTQARLILEGLEADVVTFNQVTDVQILHDRGRLIPADWQKRFPNNSSPYYSLPAFVVRAGNPKNIKNWDDLTRSDVQAIFPNPKTSGNARYTYLAAYAFALDKFGGDEAKADAFVKQILANVPVFDTGGRGSTTTFVENGKGDVLITFESETNLIVEKAGADKYQVVVPPASLLAEFPVALIDKVVDKRGSRPVATAFLNYLYSPEGQDILLKFNNRVNNQSLMEARKSQFPDVKLYRVEDVFGGWEKVTKVHFGSTGKIEKLMPTGR